MNITQIDIPFGVFFDSYSDDGERGCYAYGGKCCLRPAFSPKVSFDGKGLAENVVRSALSGYPIGPVQLLVYPNDTYRVMDGRRRLASLCDYRSGLFEVDGKKFGGLSKKEREGLDAYPIRAYICDGTPEELLEWFERSSAHEGRFDKTFAFNSVYGGAWMDDALLRLSEYDIASLGHIFKEGELNAPSVRARVIEWQAQAEDVTVDEYVRVHGSDKDASFLVKYLDAVVAWVDNTFGRDFADVTAGLAWGELYNDYGTADCKDAASTMERLLADDSVTNKPGIVLYALCGDISGLKLRKFTDKDKAEKLEQQGGKCRHCGSPVDTSNSRISCIAPWPHGHVDTSNAEVLCLKCDRTKRRNLASTFG